MGVKKEYKLNQLLKKWPKGTVITQAGMDKLSISRQLAQQYLSSGWIERVGKGAFVQSGDQVDWLGGVYALQNQLRLNVHVAAVTALGLKGLGHYLPTGEGEIVYLFAEGKLPAWFLQYPWDVRISYHSPVLFQGMENKGFSDVDRGAFKVKVSSPERAILENIHLATSNTAYDHALELLSGLTTLRPKLLQELLEACQSVKVKRFFLWASKQAAHKWFQRLDISKITLGKGKRSLYKGGVFDSSYQITVPDLGRPENV